MSTPSVTLVRVFDRSWAAWLRGVHACRRKPSPRKVHALRVDCRRLEALLDVLGHTTAAPVKALQRLKKRAVQPLDALSPLRDDQVQRRHIARAADEHRLEALLDEVRRREGRHRKRARRALAEIDLAEADAAAGRLRKSVVRDQGAPTTGDRAGLLINAVEAAAAAVTSRLADADIARPRSLHRLRVAIKRLRYVTEIASEIAPQVHVATLPELRALQRRLGRVHDAELLAARIDRFLERRRPHRADVRAFEAHVDAERARTMRTLSRALPALHPSAQRTAR